MVRISRFRRDALWVLFVNLLLQFFEILKTGKFNGEIKFKNFRQFVANLKEIISLTLKRSQCLVKSDPEILQSNGFYKSLQNYILSSHPSILIQFQLQGFPFLFLIFASFSIARCFFFARNWKRLRTEMLSQAQIVFKTSRERREKRIFMFEMGRRRRKNITSSFASVSCCNTTTTFDNKQS